MDDEPTFDTCPGPNCGATIRWAITEGGKRIAMDLDLSPDGILQPVTLAGGQRRVRVLTGGQLPAQHPCFVPHDRTCPNSENARRRRAAMLAKCRASCGIPMDPWLPANGWRYHVNCAPLPVREHYEAAKPAPAPEAPVRADEQLPGIDERKAS